MLFRSENSKDSTKKLLELINSVKLQDRNKDADVGNGLEDMGRGKGKLG